MPNTITLTRTAAGYSLPPHNRPVYDRRDICKRAHQIARERRAATATAAYHADGQVILGRVHHLRTFSAFLAATPIDFSAAMKAAWAEARRDNDATPRNALVTAHTGALATVGARIRNTDWVALLSSAARFVERRYCPINR